MAARSDPQLTGLRLRLHELIFEADTTAGKSFDDALKSLVSLHGAPESIIA